MSALAARPSISRLRGLYVIADDDPRWRHDPIRQARAALSAGARAVQLRAKHATDRRTLAWGEVLRALTDAHGALFFVNDRFDLALAVAADGVHLGQRDVPPTRLPAAVRERLLVGRSTHTAEQVEAALGEPIDYLAFGPVLGTTSKQSAYPARGLPALGEVARRVAPRVLVAIGGIQAPGAPDVLRAGATALAVISAVAAADDPDAAARALVRAVESVATP